MSRWRKIFLGVVAFLLSGVFSSYDPHPAQSTAPLQKPLQHDVAVTVKLVQVYVTDKSGKPAMNLRKSDFRLFDNGQAVEITEFEVHAAEETPARPPAAPAAKTEPAPAPASTQMGRKFIFFFDHDSNDLESIAKARTAALHFLDTAVLPNDEVGVISHAFMGGLVMHCFLTSDRSKVREAILRVRDVPGRKSGGTGGADTSAAGTIVVSSQSDPSGAAVVVSRSASGGGRVQFTWIECPTWPEPCAISPAIKNILYFSQGGSVSNRETRERLEEMSREFAAANAPLYTINTETPDPFNPKGTQGEPALALVAQALRRQILQGDRGDPTHSRDRRGHPVPDPQLLRPGISGSPKPGTENIIRSRVEITRAEYLVQAQSGYYNPKPFSDYTEVEKELHLFDLALSEKPAGKPPLLFPMRILRFESGDEAGEDAGVLLMAQIPPAVISAFAGRRIEVVALVLDDRDNPAVRYQLKPDLDKVRGREVVFTAEAFLRPGAHRCRIILRDLESGDAALAYAAVTVPASISAGGLKLFSPLLLTSYRPLLAWEGETKKGGPALDRDLPL